MSLEPGSALHTLAARGQGEQGVQRSDHVFRRLLEDIAAGKFNWGAKLLIEELAEAYSVSTTPVRDALNRLVSHEVVTKVPYQGYFVKTFGRKEIQDLYEVRAGLEMLAVNLACERITADQLERLKSLNSLAVEALEKQDLVAYQATNHGFHSAIFEASGNDLLIRTMDTIAVQMQLMVAQTIKVPGRPDRAISEHGELIGLLERRDTEGAEDLMRRHVYAAMEDLGLEDLE